MQINRFWNGNPSVSVWCFLKLSTDIKYRPVEYLDARDHQARKCIRVRTTNRPPSATKVTAGAQPRSGPSPIIALKLSVGDWRRLGPHYIGSLVHDLSARSYSRTAIYSSQLEWRLLKVAGQLEIYRRGDVDNRYKGRL